MPTPPFPDNPTPPARPGKPTSRHRLGVLVGTTALAVTGLAALPPAAQADPQADPAADPAASSYTIRARDGVLSLEPGELDFGRVDLGGRVDGFVTARNNGNGPLTFGGTSLFGPQARDYELAASGSPRCVSGLELGPGGFCEIGVRFTPSAGGARTATLSVTAGGATLSTRLAGAGAAPAAPTDTTAPTVTAVRPAAGAQRISRDVTVSALFSEVVRGVNRATYTLTNLRTGRKVPTRLSRVGRRWRLEPVARLSASTSYRVRLTGTIRDAAGNRLRPRDWRFTTRG